MEVNYTQIMSLGFEIIDGDRGKNYPHQNELMDNGYCLFLSANNVTKTGFNFASTVFIDKGKDTLLRNGRLERGDIVITTRGTVGNVAYYNSFIQFDRMRINSGMLIIRNRGNNDTQFLYYVLRSEWFQAQIKAMQTGSAQPQLPKSLFAKMKIPLPDVASQKKIASVMAVIDRKIQNNAAINDNLADLLQSVYQQWFGDVDSATTQGNLADICSYSKDKVSVADLTTDNYFSTENMLPGKAGATEATSLPTMNQTTACHAGDTLISNIRPYFQKIIYCQDECGCSTDVLCFTPHQSSYAAYLFSTLYADRFFDFMVAGAKGTKMPRGDKQQIMTYPIALPDETELNAFNSVAVPILAKRHANVEENKRLSSLRNALLPKLMSGEIDVSDVQL